MTYVLNDWDRFTSKLPPTHPLREAILKSWSRLRDAGVDHAAEEFTLRRVSDADLERRQTLHRELIQAAWSEEAMGTNGAGTAVVSGNVVAVFGPEHYMRRSHGLTCLAAPIRDSLGAIVGAVDLSTQFLGWRPHQLVFVAYAAQMIERDFALLGT
jgi:transcriptional regulator of acetoin/glycerol metabolism